MATIGTEACIELDHPSIHVCAQARMQDLSTAMAACIAHWNNRYIQLPATSKIIVVEKNIKALLGAHLVKSLDAVCNMFGTRCARDALSK